MALRLIDPIDQHVGGRIRLRRVFQKKSQTELALFLGVTFQQIQKYEKGTNRVGAGRMQKIAIFLECPVSSFYEGQPGAGTPESPETPAWLMAFMSTSEGMKLIQSFGLITDPIVRLAVVRMVQSIAAMPPPKKLTITASKKASRKKRKKRA